MTCLGKYAECGNSKASSPPAAPGPPHRGPGAFNISNNRGVSDFDRAYRITAQYVYELPRLFHNRVLEGWMLNTMVTLQSGSPFSLIGASTRNAFWAFLGASDARSPGRYARWHERFGPAIEMGTFLRLARVPAGDGAFTAVVAWPGTVRPALLSGVIRRGEH